MKTWFTVAEAAQYAGVSRDTIYTACGGASCTTRASAADDRKNV